MSTRETVGAIYAKLKSQQQDKVDVFEFVNATQADFMPRLIEMINRDKQKTDKDFFVEVCIRRNAFMPDVFETYMKSRHTCPTPFYDRSVFQYDRHNDRIIFLWHIPSLEECDYYLQNILHLRPDEKEAFKDVLDFKEGTLLRKAKQLNSEINDYGIRFFRKDSDGREPITS